MDAPLLWNTLDEAADWLSNESSNRPSAAMRLKETRCGET